ncbi:heterokaryon incompatibility protein-domain-containing protein, partial [Usnea florida]
MELKEVCLEELRTLDTDIDFRFFTKSDQRPCSSPIVATHRTLDGTRRSRIDSIVVEWLRECVEKHDCQGSTTLPSRVLDISQFSEGGIHLYVTDQEIEPYAALSHCWGGEVPMKTTTMNYKAQQNHIAVDDLPQNFKDAIEVTRRLGLRYLWIDALCIIQDDLSDWEVESREMSSIYGDAHLVIGADGAKGAEEGFLRDSPEYNSMHADAKSALNPLSQRAWTFQEQLLARRMVHFTKEEMVWECKSRYSCECTQFDDFSQNTSKDDWISGDTANMGVQWYSFVNEVCVRQLTFKTDILPCLSGIAAQMEASMMGRYLAGLWEEDLLLGLTWSYEELQTRMVPQQAPSWSWASL